MDIDLKPTVKISYDQLKTSLCLLSFHLTFSAKFLVTLSSRKRSEEEEPINIYN